MRNVVIKLRGCDDTTYIPMEVTDAQYNFLADLSHKSQLISTYCCMPILEVIDDTKVTTLWDQGRVEESKKRLEESKEICSW